MSKEKKHLPLRPCVGLMILNHENKVWTGRRIAVPSMKSTNQLWQMPQGGIDKGEQPFEAALREMEEEIGTNKASLLAEHPTWLDYRFSAALSKNAFKGKYGGQTQKWFALRYEGQDKDIDISGGADHKAEFDAWKWQDMTALPELVVPFKRDVYEAVVQEFSALLK